MLSIFIGSVAGILLVLSVCATLVLCKGRRKRLQKEAEAEVETPEQAQEEEQAGGLRAAGGAMVNTAKSAPVLGKLQPGDCSGNQSFVFACNSAGDDRVVGGNGLAGQNNVADAVDYDDVGIPDACNLRLEDYPLPDAKILGCWVRKVYGRYNPTKVNSIDELLEKYKGREDELIEQIVVKYRLGPCAPRPVTIGAMCCSTLES